MEKSHKEEGQKLVAVDASMSVACMGNATVACLLLQDEKGRGPAPLVLATLDHEVWHESAAAAELFLRGAATAARWHLEQMTTDVSFDVEECVAYHMSTRGQRNAEREAAHEVKH